tara:strand:+ start:79 stop:462 length:384 start_codon:yes stop_codon:yes gene_type:complete
MLKFSSIILSFTFLLLNSGLHIDFHYCNDELTEVSLNHSEDHCDTVSKKCCVSCDDIHLNIENDNDQFNNDVQRLKKYPVYSILTTSNTPEVFFSEKQKKVKSQFYSNSSPPKEKLYQLNCQYCFYG